MTCRRTHPALRAGRTMEARRRLPGSPPRSLGRASLVVAVLAALFAGGCSSGDGQTDTGGDVIGGDVIGTCPAAALSGGACSAGADCDTGTICQGCALGTYAWWSAHCYCRSGHWFCLHGDCIRGAPGTYLDPDCTIPYVADADADDDVPAEAEVGADTGGDDDADVDAAVDTDADVEPGRSPLVFRCADEAPVCSPTPPEDCTAADLAFVTSEYGSSVRRADDGGGARTVYRLVAFVERVGPANIDVLVVDRAGDIVTGVPVAFYWPDAPDASRPDEWYAVKITTPTGADGVAGFALGSGAYLSCCGCGGPHAIWVSEPGPAPDTTIPSDLADRLGMLGGTNHRHLDLIFQRVDPPPGPAPVDAGRCPLR